MDLAGNITESPLVYRVRIYRKMKFAQLKTELDKFRLSRGMGVQDVLELRM